MSTHDLLPGTRPPEAKHVHHTLPPPLRDTCLEILALGLGFVALDEVDSALVEVHPAIELQQPALDHSDMLVEFHVPRLFELAVLQGTFDEAMSAIAIGARVINTTIRRIPEHERRAFHVHLSPDDAIRRLNATFVLHGVGYRFSSEQNGIVPADQQQGGNESRK